LENFHGLLAHYDASEAQRWSEDRGFWLGQWKGARAACRSAEPRPGLHAKEWEALAVIHTDLRDTEAIYTKELLRFGQKEAPRLHLIRERLETVGRRIGAAAPATAASPHPGDQH